MNALPRSSGRPLAIALALLMAAGAGAGEALAQGAAQLTTSPSRPFVTAAGVCFDLTATTPLTVYRVGLATAGRSGTPASTETVEVWKRDGGCGAGAGTGVPFDAQPSGWVLVGRGDIAVSSSGGIVQVPVDLNIFLRAGDTAGIAVYSPTYGNAFRTENPPAGPTTFSDGRITLESLDNILYTEQVGLMGTVSSFTYYSRRDRVNVLGTVWYDAGATPATTPPSVTTLSLPGGTEAAVYAATLRATGGTAPYRWQVTGLPAGLVFEPATGVVSGIPNAAGTSSLTVTVTDAAGATATRALTLAVAPAPAPAGGLTITTPPTLPDAVSGWAYTEFLAAAGGGPALTWTAATPPPAWLAVESSGKLRGNPGVAHEGTSVFTVRVNDGAATATKVLQITVKDPGPSGNPLSVSTLFLNEGMAGRAYSTQLAALGGTPPYRWSALGLPAGLALDAATGEIRGVPGAAGRSTVNVTVADAAGATAIRAFTLMVLPGGATAPLAIATASPLPDASVGTPYALALAATGGSGAYGWTASGLPAWLSLGAGGALAGTPGLADIGTSIFSVAVDDGVTSAGATLAVTVVPAAGGAPLAIATSALPPATVGVAYASTLAATGGTPGYAWSLAGATGLPAGLALDPATGTIQGTPAAAAQSVVIDVRVTDATSARADRALALTVFPAAGATTIGRQGARTGGGGGGCAFHPASGGGYGGGLEALALAACLLALGRFRGRARRGAAA